MSIYAKSSFNHQNHDYYYHF